MDVTIRRATAGDAEGIAKLFDDYRLFFGEPSDLPLAQDTQRRQWPGATQSCDGVCEKESLG